MHAEKTFQMNCKLLGAGTSEENQSATKIHKSTNAENGIKTPSGTNKPFSDSGANIFVFSYSVGYVAY